jgi:hypothetical protein
MIWGKYELLDPFFPRIHSDRASLPSLCDGGNCRTVPERNLKGTRHWTSITLCTPTVTKRDEGSATHVHSHGDRNCDFSRKVKLNLMVIIMILLLLLLLIIPLPLPLPILRLLLLLLLLHSYYYY